LPLAKIRKICKLDPEVKNLQREALVLIARAAELATARLGKEAVKVAQIQNRRKLLPEDVAQVCASHDVFAFLRDDIRDLAREQRQIAETEAVAKKKAPPPTSSTNHAAAAGRHGKPLTDYFTAQPKA
jgi:histone H3/H4